MQHGAQGHAAYLFMVQVAFLHQRLHVVDPDPGLHSTAETALVLVELQAVDSSLLSHGS